VIYERRKFRRETSGQLLILSALAVAILITSTLSYVYELDRQVTYEEDSVSGLILSLKQASRNTVIGSLANISRSSDFGLLETNLGKLSNACTNLSYASTCKVDFAPLNDSTYESGILISWNESGKGVTSSFVNFTLDVYDDASRASFQYSVNVTSSVDVDGSWIVYGTDKLVTVNLHVSDEQGPASARIISAFFYDGDGWIEVDSGITTWLDYGDGGYRLSFVADVLSDSVPVSVQMVDYRGILVIGNFTCTAQAV
jgi:hypothetical protein